MRIRVYSNARVFGREWMRAFALARVCARARIRERETRKTRATPDTAGKFNRRSVSRRRFSWPLFFQARPFEQVAISFLRGTKFTGTTDSRETKKLEKKKVKESNRKRGRCPVRLVALLPNVFVHVEKRHAFRTVADHACARARIHAHASPEDRQTHIHADTRVHERVYTPAYIYIYTHVQHPCINTCEDTDTVQTLSQRLYTRAHTHTHTETRTPQRKRDRTDIKMTREHNRRTHAKHTTRCRYHLLLL